jgi:DNA adenine methylase
MAMTNSAPVRPQRLRHFTPLRYPGGKGKLTVFVKALLESNCLLDGEYVEPYAGGAGIAIELLLHEYVNRIHINDVSRPIYAFWSSVLNYTDDLSRKIVDTKVTVAEWDKQKSVLSTPDDHDDLSLGFATFFLNRTNRSGILNGGIIGGRDQTGPWKIDARFNAKELVTRIITIARMRSRISLTCKDALKFLTAGTKKWPTRTLLYLDPPYYVKGSQLYYDFYKPGDHAQLAEFIMRGDLRQQWMVSYDNVPEIHKLYAGARNVIYDIAYSARSASKGSEVMFFRKGLKVPPMPGKIKR